MEPIKLHYRLDELDKLQPPYLIVRRDGDTPFAMLLAPETKNCHGVNVITPLGTYSLHEHEYEFVRDDGTGQLAQEDER